MKRLILIWTILLVAVYCIGQDSDFIIRKGNDTTFCRIKRISNRKIFFIYNRDQKLYNRLIDVYGYKQKDKVFIPVNYNPDNINLNLLYPLTNFNIGFEVQNKADESGIYTGPCCMTNLKHHTFSVGLLIVNNLSLYVKQNRPLFGYQFEYRLNPFRERRIFNCSLSFEINRSSGIIQSNSSQYFRDGGSYILVVHPKDDLVLFSIYASIVSNFRFLKRFYSTISFGLGGSRINQNVTGITDSGNSFGFYDTEVLNMYHTPDLLIKVGFGYYLWNLKKKE